MSRKPLVLIADDDPDILMLMSLTLERDGWEVVEAGDGVNAYTSALGRVPNLVVLDLMMPGMDGHEIFERLRAMPETATVPVIFLTARGKDDALEGADAVYMQKPFDTIELVHAARSLTEGTP